MNLSTNYFSAQLCGYFASAFLLCNVAQAAEAALIEGERITITAQDIQADALRMPAEMRGSLLSKAQTVTQIASNLYARRAMAEKAQMQGLDKDPEVAATLRLARDKVLSDALLAKMDKENNPTDAVAEGMARNIYIAKPERFNAPEEVRVRHILIAKSEATGRVQAEKILEELKAGADFAKLAKERSADKGSAAKGGDLGVFARGQMVPEFDEAAFALQKPGDLSNIVESQFGFHILKLDMRRPAGRRTFEEVREELIKEVRNNVLQEARVAEAQKLQQSGKINMPVIQAFSAGYNSAP